MRGGGAFMGGPIGPPPGSLPTIPGAPASMSKPGKLTASFESYLKSDVLELGLKVAKPVEPKKPEPKKK